MLLKRNVPKEAELLPTTCFSSRRPASRGPFFFLSGAATSAVVLLLLLVGRHLLASETRTPTLAEAVTDLTPARSQAQSLAREITEENRRQEATKAAGEAVESRAKAADEASCADNKRECGQWARAGECVRNPQFMQPECCETCTRAPQLSPQLSPAQLREIRPAAQPTPPQPSQQSHLPVIAPCADQSTRCTEWTHAGECTANPAFMHSTCRKSCGACSKQSTGTGLSSATGLSSPAELSRAAGLSAA
mmetsp:Transcript_55854/g.133852  ORF Transcript_55854/g.133852 Transcript_55854/m.133852 type:complete len:249 (-) Transcript_55854:83-829(-)